MRHGAIPIVALRSILAVADVGKRDVVRGDHAAACAHFDGKIAERQSALHGEAADGLARVFHKVTGGAAGRHAGDDIEREIFGGDARAGSAVDGDAHRLGFLLQDALRGQRHLHLAGADAKSYGTHCAVRRGVAVAADDGHAGQRQAALGADDMDDSVLGMHHAEVRETKFGCVLLKRVDLGARYGILDGFVLIVRGSVVVGHAKNLVGAEDAQLATAKSGEGLGARHFMTVKAVDIELRRAVGHGLDDVGVPDFVEKGIH